ncbi:hypothetical protein MHYP_G00097200 [Metynnis hypsauchen]
MTLSHGPDRKSRPDELHLLQSRDHVGLLQPERHTITVFHSAAETHRPTSWRTRRLKTTAGHRHRSEERTGQAGPRRRVAFVFSSGLRGCVCGFARTSPLAVNVSREKPSVFKGFDRGLEEGYFVLDKCLLQTEIV